MYIGENVTVERVALEDLKKFLQSGRKSLRLAAARSLGDFVGFRNATLRQLKKYRIDAHGPYAIREQVTPGCEIAFFFTAESASAETELHLIHVAEFLGEAQFRLEKARARERI